MSLENQNRFNGGSVLVVISCWFSFTFTPYWRSPWSLIGQQLHWSTSWACYCIDVWFYTYFVCKFRLCIRLHYTRPKLCPLSNWQTAQTVQAFMRVTVLMSILLMYAAFDLVRRRLLGGMYWIRPKKKVIKNTKKNEMLEKTQTQINESNNHQKKR